MSEKTSPAVRARASPRDRDRPRKRSISDIFFEHCAAGPRTRYQDVGRVRLFSIDGSYFSDGRGRHRRKTATLQCGL